MKTSHSPAHWRRRALLLTAVAAAAAASIPGVVSAAYPDRPVKLVIGFAPGTAPDVVGRLFAEQLSVALGKSVIVENRAGAGGQLAAQAVAMSPPDGYTLLLAETGSTIVAPVVQRRLPYNPARDLRIVAKVTDTPFVFVTSSNGPKSMAAFLEQARSSDRVNIGTFGPGGAPHLLSMQMASQLGFKIEPVHYRSVGDLIAAIQSGDVMATFAAPSTVVPHIQGGKMRGLATTSAARLDMLPDVPTFGEVHVLNFEFLAWLSFFAPSTTPQALVDRIGDALVVAAKDNNLVSKMRSAGTLVNVLTGEESIRFMAAETVKWQRVARNSGFTLD